MPRWAVRLLNDLDDADRRARALVEPITAEKLNWQPAPGVWSVGQCLEHLCNGNEIYLPSITAALAGRRIAPVQEITPGWFGRWFLRTYMEPSPETKRAKSPKKIVPAARTERPVLDRFLAANQAIRDVISRAAPHDVNRIRFKNPFVPVIYFTVGTGLQILCTHERRHLLQAERVRALAEFPRGAEI